MMQIVHTLIIFELLSFFSHLSPNFSENASVFVSSTLEDQLIFSPSLNFYSFPNRSLITKVKGMY